MKRLFLLVPILFVASAGAVEPDRLIEQLPVIRSQALADTAKLRAGNTTEMVDAAVVVRDRLLPLIVSRIELGRKERERCPGSNRA